MCGITGTLNLTKAHAVCESDLRQMLAMIRHRGPDQFGIYMDDQVGMGSARLSIIDLSGGQQPISNEDETIWIVFNGEIFNYVELRPELEARGHRFSTNTDTECIIHLYEEYGPECVNYLNGQCAIALWDSSKRSLFLARDRLGILPLYYTLVDGALIFGSEIKAILADRRVTTEIDPISLDQVFTYWSTLTPRTVFRDILEIPPGHYLIAREGRIKVERYWDLAFPAAGGGAPAKQGDGRHQLDEYLEEFQSLLVDATRIRLRADVPVGAYLSGGLDSSTTAAIIRNYTHNRLDTFSISFSDPDFDESAYQLKMEHMLSDLGAAAQSDDEYFFDISSAGFIRYAAAVLFMINKKFEPSHRSVTSLLSTLKKTPEDFSGRWDSLVRYDPGISKAQRFEVAQLIARSILAM